jgi:hypothetical protein
VLSNDLWGDRFNNLSSKGDRYYHESRFLADRINNHLLKAIAITVSLDF